MVEFPPPGPVGWARRDGHVWTLRLRVQPGARRTEVVGEHGEQLKVRVAAPAEGGRANAELVRLLAAWAGVRRAGVRIVAGAGSRSKVVEVDLGE